MKQKDCFITFDMDWVPDEVMEWFVEFCDESEIRGTLMVTNDSPLLNKIRSDGKLELGIHPNFNQLLSGEDDIRKNMNGAISLVKDIVPEAVTVRSHALVTGSVIENAFRKAGLKYELNFLYVPKPGDRISAWKDIYGIIRIPFIFEDDIWFTGDVSIKPEYYLDGKWDVPLIFNFHPIHLYLNTCNQLQYDRAKKHYQNVEKLKKHVNKEEFGTRDFFKRLVSLLTRKDIKMLQISEKEW